MTISLEKGAETYQEVTKDLNLSITKAKEDSVNLLNDTYVDDGTTEGYKNVDRMIRVKLKDRSFMGTIPSMIEKVSLKSKTIVT